MEASTKEISIVETCRLRNTLNEDCLLKVLEYLNVNDLIQISKLDKYFLDLIAKWIITKKLVNWSILDANCELDILNMFGKSIRKIVLHGHDFNHILLTIVKYCKPSTLTEVHLVNYDDTLRLNAAFVERSMPFFTNLRKLSLTKHSCDTFFVDVALTARNLQILVLRYTDIRGSWLSDINIKNLRELRLYEPTYISLNALKKFLRNHPNLETFSSVGGRYDITGLGDTLVNHCLNLTKFEDFRYFQTPETPDTTRYNFLSKLANLNSVTLTSNTYCGSDLHHILLQLQTKNISRLNFCMDFNQTVDVSEDDRKRIMQYSFAHFISLKEVGVYVPYVPLKYDSDLRCEFIMQFASQLRNLEKMSVQFTNLSEIDKILEFVPTIRTLSISQTTFQHLPVEIRKIVRKLRVIRQMECASNTKKLHVVVNMDQWRELQVYKDVNDIMTITVENDNQSHF